MADGELNEENLGARQFAYRATSLLAGTAWMGVAAVVAAASGFFAATVLSRHWGPERFGQYAALVAWGTAVSVLADGGLAQVLSREAAHHPRSLGALHWTALRRRTVISPLAVVVAVLAIWSLGQAVPSVVALTAVCVTLQLDLALDLALTVWRVVGRYPTAALWRIGRRASYVLAAVLAAILGLGVTGAAILILASGLPFAMAANGTVAKHSWTPGGTGLGLPRGTTGLFWVAGVLYWIYFQADQVLLAALSNHRELGLYAPAVAVASVPLMLTAVTAEVVLPRLFHVAAGVGSEPEVERRTLALVPPFAALAGFIAVLFSLHADLIIRLAFGEAFQGAGPLLTILSGFVAVRYLAVPAFLALQYIDRLRQLVAVQALAAVVNVASNLALIPHFGAKGAAVATLGSETIMLVGVWLCVPRAWVVPMLRSVWPHLAVAAALLGLNQLLGGGGISKIGLTGAFVVLSGGILVRPVSRFHARNGATMRPDGEG